MVIRRANLGDLDELLQLIAGEAQHFPPVPSRDQLIKKIMAGNVLYFMGIMIITTPYKSSLRQGDYSYQGASIYFSHVASRDKGKGNGKKVLLAALSEFRLYTVFLNVFADNERARAVYEKSGFFLQGIHQYKGRDVARYYRPRRTA